MKKNAKLILISLLLFTVIGLLFTACSAKEEVITGENLIKNGGFEQVSNGSASNWFTEQYRDEPNAFSIVNEGAKSGDYCAKIDSRLANDSRFVQTVKVKGNAIYKLSAWVKTEGIPNKESAVGANITVLDIFSRSVDLTGTNDWTYVEFYGKTDKKQTEIQVALRLGFYSGDNYGVAYFDDVRLERVASAPEGVEVASLKKVLNNKGGGNKNVTPNAITVRSKVFGIAFITLLAGAIVFYFFKHKKYFTDAASSRTAFFLLVVAGILVRIYKAATYQGFDVDINCWIAWGGRMLAQGPFKFYSADAFCDYPPLYMMVLAIPTAIRELLGQASTSPVGLVLIKSPAIICEVLTGVFIYKVAGKKLGKSMGLLLSAFYLLNPAIIVNSASWGQVDGVLTLLLVLAIYYMIKRKMHIAVFIYLAALLTKPQALEFAPIMLFGAIKGIVDYIKMLKGGTPEESANARKQILNFVGSILASLVIFILISLAMQNDQESIFWLFEKYFGTISSYGYASLSAFNFMSLIGGQWTKLDNPAIFGISFGALSIILIALVIIATAILYFIKFKNRSMFLIAAFIAAALYCFAGQVHERYLYPALALLLMAYVVHEDRRLLHVFAGFTLTQYINVALVLYIHNSPQTYFSKSDPILLIGSLINVLIFIYFAKITFEIQTDKADTKHTKEYYLPEIDEEEVRLQLTLASKAHREKAVRKPFLNAKDWAIMLAITVIYAAVAFINLGTTNTPENYWQPDKSGQYVIADFGEETTLQRLYYHNSINEGTFTISYSLDKENWKQIKTVSYKNGDMYKWNLVSVPQITTDIGEKAYPTARYIKVSVSTPYMRLNEIVAFASQDAESAIKIVRVESNGEAGLEHGYECLFDEQYTAAKRPSYLNSMYFDEIYHARTAYEHINEWRVYEITHPPLGKVIMSWGVSLFGMNPFGWRFAGTMMGILMLPAMYCFGKLLFKKTSWATCLTLLMTLDGMHFVQTRIATIDSYGVFFIILMYLFMYKYYTMSFYEDKLYKTFIPLGLSGIAFGLGAASKWIGIYAGAGLAVIFFITVFRRLHEYYRATDALKGDLSRFTDQQVEYLKEIKSTFMPKLIKTLLFCVGFFVIIPAIIYCLSYIPYFNAPGNKGAWYKTIWENQKYMLNYHGGLGNDTHFFRSPWYEWPVLGLPMWYYDGSELAAGQMECISCFGNPLIWWSGLLATISSIIILVKKAVKRYHCQDLETGLRLNKEIQTLLFVAIGLAANYLTWVLIPRSTFIYHYFASLPFIMIFTVYIFRQLYKRYGKKAVVGIVVFFCLAALLFALFYPVWSGMEISMNFSDTFQRWFDSWYFHRQ